MSGRSKTSDLHRTNIYLTTSQRDWLKEYAEEKGFSTAEIVRRAIDHFREVMEFDHKAAAEQMEEMERRIASGEFRDSERVGEGELADFIEVARSTREDIAAFQEALKAQTEPFRGLREMVEEINRSNAALREGLRSQFSQIDESLKPLREAAKQIRQVPQLPKSGTQSPEN